MAEKPVDLSDPISLRLPVDLLADIDRIADSCDRPRSWVIVRALGQYRAAEGADVLAAREGLDQASRGEVVEIGDLLAEMDEIIDKGQAA